MIQRLPIGPMSRGDAINLAAWLVALAETQKTVPRFMEVFVAITSGDA